MAIFTKNNENTVDEEIMTIEELSNMINNDEVHIFFSENVFDNCITEFVIDIKGDDARSIIIRNKYLDGSNSKPITHDPSLKYVYNDKYIHDGKRGIPFDVKKMNMTVYL